MADIAKTERILLDRRKHWFVVVGDLLGPFFVALLPFVIYPYIEGRELPIGTEYIIIGAPTTLLTYLGSVWLLVFWMRIVGVWIDYYLDVWTVTEERIVSREQRGFFNRRTSIFSLARIQDITVETKGLLPTLLHFGDIHVQTAGEQQEFIMRGIANPKHVREIILKAQDQLQTRKEERL